MIRRPLELAKNIADAFVKRMDHVVWKVVNEKGILLNLDNGSYFDINPVGLSVWKLCDGRKNAEEILGRVSRLYRADEKRVKKDVLVFIAELKRRRLIRLSSSPARKAGRG